MAWMGISTLRRATKVSTSDAKNGPGCSGFTRRAGDAASASAATTLRSTSGEFANILDSWAPRPVWELQEAVLLRSGFHALLRRSPLLNSSTIAVRLFSGSRGCQRCARRALAAYLRDVKIYEPGDRLTCLPCVSPPRHVGKRLKPPRDEYEEKIAEKKRPRGTN